MLEINFTLLNLIRKFLKFKSYLTVLTLITTVNIHIREDIIMFSKN